jgi:hypothetical protein
VCLWKSLPRFILGKKSEGSNEANPPNREGSKCVWLSSVALLGDSPLDAKPFTGLKVDGEGGLLKRGRL